jgi:hypothetical protein
MTEESMDVLRTRRCECGAADCAVLVEISWEEQDEVDHADTNTWWIVSPEHEPQGARSWRVVRETDRFMVVEVEEADLAED